MKDVKVTTIRIDLPIAFPVRQLRDNPLTLEIRGSRFNVAKFVYINDLAIPNFTIVNNNVIIVEVPSIIKRKDISSISVVSEKAIANQKHLIHFEFGSSFRSVSGLQRLVQHFVKELLQEPGSNAFDQDAGGGLLSMIGKSTVNDGVPATSDIIDGVNRVKNNIIKRQGKRNNIPLDERLLNVSINSVKFKDKVSIELILTLTNMAGTTIDTALSL